MPVTIVRPSERDLQPLHEDMPILMRVIADGLDGEPYVHITEVPAGHHIAAHSHSETEVTIILSGSAHIGGTVCDTGSIVVIPANEEYSLDAGDEPLTFAVVRPRKATYAFSS